MTLPRIGISLGDPGGIGPEVTLKALAAPKLPEAEFILFGARSVILSESDRLGLSSVLRRFSIKDVDPSRGSFITGKPSPENGRASFACVEQAVEAAGRGELQAVVTAPVSKYSWRLAGVAWAGHTDYLEHLWPGAIMSFFSERLNLALYSHHLPLRAALQRVLKEPLQDFLLRLFRGAVPILGREPELLVSGLNPHAGEDGLLGTEEQDEIIPALEAVRGEGVPVSGPYPPDIVARMALDRPDRLLVSLYHDQGLVAFKLIAFDTGVNVTLGLPFIRTSPDHGTAFDISGKGDADPRSMLAALQLAYRSVGASP
jgi:4-hydroxythreonine-4-phosphate dehydrogenase